MGDQHERIAIYIDGGNFYQRLKDLGLPGKGMRFSYNDLVDFIARGRQVVSKGYYVGIVRNHDGSAKSQELVERQQKLLAGLDGDGFAIKRGRIVYDHKIREKGVDVKLALDLVIGAVDNLYDTALVVSSDTDLVPAIQHVRYKGKQVEYVGFAHRPSLGMTRECSLAVSLLADDLRKFVKPKEDLGHAA